MRRVYFFESLNLCPHLETAFELAMRHLDEGDAVTFYSLGRAVPYSDFYAERRVPGYLAHWLQPEARAARLVRSRNFRFVCVPPLAIPEVEGLPAQSLPDLMELKYRGADLGMGVASSLISQSGNSQLDPKANRDLMAASLGSAAAIYDFVLEELRSSPPDLVYLFNGRFANSKAVLRACEAMGVPYRVHERGADKSRFAVWSFTPHDGVKLQKEMLEHWDKADREQAKAIARRWFADRRAGRETNWRSFTEAQRPFHLPEFRASRIVTYFSSSDDEFAAVGDLQKWQGWKDQLDAVRSLIKVTEAMADVQLVIRLHPHLMYKHADERSRWLALSGTRENVEVIAPDSPVDSYALLEASDVVVTGGSTVGIEAVYWGTASILLGPSIYDALGAVHVAHSVETFAKLLAREALQVEPAKALPYGYHAATFGEEFKYYEPDTLSTGRFLGEDLHRKPPRVVRPFLKSKKAKAQALQGA